MSLLDLIYFGTEVVKARILKREIEDAKRERQNACQHSKEYGPVNDIVLSGQKRQYRRWSCSKCGFSKLEILS